MAETAPRDDMIGGEQIPFKRKEGIEVGQAATPKLRRRQRSGRDLVT